MINMNTNFIFFIIIICISIMIDAQQDMSNYDEYSHMILLHNNPINTHHTLQYYQQDDVPLIKPQHLQLMSHDVDVTSTATAAAVVKHPMLLHFGRIVNDQIKKEVEDALNTKLELYLPHHTFLVSLNSSQSAQALQLSQVKHVSYWYPRYRLQQKLHDYMLILQEKGTVKHSETSLNTEGPFTLMISLTPEFPSRTIQSVQTLVQDWQHHIKQQLLITDNMIMIDVPSEDLVRIDVTSLELMVKLAQWMSEQPAVHFVEQREKMTVKNKWARSVLQNGINLANYSTRTGLISWDFQLDGTGQIVGVADDGLDYNSCYFYDSAKGSAPFRSFGTGTPPANAGDITQRKVVQYVFGGQAGDNRSDSHGTHTSGSVAGRMVCPTCDQTSIYDQFNGIAQNAKIAFFDIGISGQDSLTLPSNLRTQLFPWAYAVGAFIHSDSWGSTSNTYTINDNQFDGFIYLNQDFISLVAAGNDGGNGINSVGSPAVAKNVISVGAGISSANSWSEIFNPTGGLAPSANSFNYYSGTQASHFTTNSIAGFSSIGPTNDRRTKPDVVAPGHRIISARDQQTAANSCRVTTSPLSSTTGSLAALSGTSMATPLTAGLVAIIRQYYTDGFYPCGFRNISRTLKPSGALMKATLINSAQELTGDQSTSDQDLATYRSISRAAQGYPNIYQGYGRPNLKNTLRFNDNNSPRLLVPRDMNNNISFGDPQLSVGQKHVYEIVVNSVTSYLPKFTLVWTDRPSTSSAAPNLVNDLDLTVTLKSTTVTYFGNNEVKPSVTGSATRNPATEADRISNVEQVILRTATVGQVYVVTVTAHNVPSGINGFQAYALVMSGDISMTSNDPISSCSTGGSVLPAPTAQPVATCIPSCSPYGGCIDTNVCSCADGMTGNTCANYPDTVKISLRLTRNITTFATNDAQLSYGLSVVAAIANALSVRSTQIVYIGVEGDNSGNGMFITFTISSPCAVYPCANTANSASSYRLRDNLRMLVLDRNSNLYTNPAARDIDSTYFPDFDQGSFTSSGDGYGEGIGISAGVVIVLVIILVIYLSYKERQNRLQKKNQQNMVTNNYNRSSPPPAAVAIVPPYSSQASHSEVIPESIEGTSGWEQHKTAEGIPYYFNKHTGESVWELEKTRR